MRASAPFKRIIIILLLIVILPALFYSAYEINSLSNTEELIGDVYRQQLDVILYSLNQYAWDVVSNWASTIAILHREGSAMPAQPFSKTAVRFLASNSSVRGLFLCDSTLRGVIVFAGFPDSVGIPEWQRKITRSLEANRSKIERLDRYRKLEYRKIEPLTLHDSVSTSQSTVLLFAVDDGAGRSGYAGMLLDQRTFISEVLSTKMREVARDEFIITVIAGNDSVPVFATEQSTAGRGSQLKEVWLFPDYHIGIALKGASIEGILRGRFYRNLVLILLLDMFLLAGVWIVYRSIRREMELVRMRSEFVSNVSHELRTPLALIRMFAETLEMGRVRDDAKKREYYSTILGETERLTRLVNNILSFSRLEAGKKEFHFLGTDLNEVASGVLDTYRHQLENGGFALTLDLGDGLSEVRGDREAIAEVLINLIDNAMKYSEKERHIAVRTGPAGGMVFLEVEDRGIGIAPQHHAKVFETFYRVSDSLVHNTKGTGLGLSLVKHITDAHGGSVTLRSTPGKGSTFRVQFPIYHHL